MNNRRELRDKSQHREGEEARRALQEREKRIRWGVGLLIGIFVRLLQVRLEH